MLKPHFTQQFDLIIAEEDLEFFDVNLAFDSPLFLDPNLLKTSPDEKERQLYSRFTAYFDLVLQKVLAFHRGEIRRKDVEAFLSFPEPGYVYLGYTEKSNEGHGLAGIFSKAMTDLFISGIGQKLLRDKSLYKNQEINPEALLIFLDKVDQDGISDLSINLLVDYLAQYTLEKAESLRILTKNLKVDQSFDFDEGHWTGGQFFKLPENPMKPGTPFILVPKHLLRHDVNLNQQLKSRTVNILTTDVDLKRRFASLIGKPLKDIKISELRSQLSLDDEALKKFIQVFERKDSESYDFPDDPFQIMALKTYREFFDKESLPEQPKTPEAFVDLVLHFINFLKHKFELEDHWKDLWIEDVNGTQRECREEIWGRKIRGMADSFFEKYPDIVFTWESQTGTGPVDFLVTFRRYKMAIEIKKLSNATTKGGEQIPSYLHGMTRQLPTYIRAKKANQAIYLTCQHYKRRSHNQRVTEIRDALPEIEKQLQEEVDTFEKLHYFNFDVFAKPSASNA